MATYVHVAPSTDDIRSPIWASPNSHALSVFSPMDITIEGRTTALIETGINLLLPASYHMRPDNCPENVAKGLMIVPVVYTPGLSFIQILEKFVIWTYHCKTQKRPKRRAGQDHAFQQFERPGGHSKE